MARLALTNDELCSFQEELKRHLSGHLEALLTKVSEFQRLTCNGPDLDAGDYAEILALPGRIEFFEADIAPSELLEETCAELIQKIEDQTIDLSKAGGVILLIKLPGGTYCTFEHILAYFKDRWHLRAATGYACFQDETGENRTSILIVVAGIDTLERFVFVGPDEDYDRKFERTWGIPRPMEIPAFLKKPATE